MSEAEAGSDVVNMRLEAKREGDYDCFFYVMQNCIRIQKLYTINEQPSFTVNYPCLQLFKIDHVISVYH